MIASPKTTVAALFSALPWVVSRWAWHVGDAQGVFDGFFFRTYCDLRVISMVISHFMGLWMGYSWNIVPVGIWVYICLYTPFPYDFMFISGSQGQDGSFRPWFPWWFPQGVSPRKQDVWLGCQEISGTTRCLGVVSFEDHLANHLANWSYCEMIQLYWDFAGFRDQQWWFNMSQIWNNGDWTILDWTSKYDDI